MNLSRYENEFSVNEYVREFKFLIAVKVMITSSAAKDSVCWTFIKTNKNITVTVVKDFFKSIPNRKTPH